MNQDIDNQIGGWKPRHIDAFCLWQDPVDFVDLGKCPIVVRDQETAQSAGKWVENQFNNLRRAQAER